MESDAFKNVVHFVKDHVIVIISLVFVQTVVKADGREVVALKVLISYSDCGINLFEHYYAFKHKKN